MHQLQLEDLAEKAYSDAGLDPQQPHVSRLARTLLGPKAIQKGPRLVRSPACLVRVGRQVYIFIAKGLKPVDALFAVAHELAHYLIAKQGLSDENEEEMANALGAALLAPRPAFRAAFKRFGDDLPALASALSATETAAALRLGEVTGQPLAVVAPERVRVRGRGWRWPDESSLRQLARRPIPGIRKTRLRDDPRRVVLSAETA